MTRAKWKNRIIKQMKDAGTYQDICEPVVVALSEILEQKDEVFEEFVNNGAQAVTEFTTDRGQVNLKKNPRLQVWEDLNNQALAFWRDLGLTPAGLKKLSEVAMKETKKGSVLAEALKRIGG